MIIIKQNFLNEITCTLFEKKKFDTDIYLFQFINSSSEESFFCLAIDQSTTNRYNAFCITEISGSTFNPANAEIRLPLTGQYTYLVYESPDSSLSPTGLNLCEQGRLLVIGNDVTAPSFSPQTNLTFYTP